MQVFYCTNLAQMQEFQCSVVSKKVGTRQGNMNHDDNSSHLRHVTVHQLQRILLLLHFGELLQLGVEKLGLGLQEVLQRVGLLLQSADLAFELRL